MQGGFDRRPVKICVSASSGLQEAELEQVPTLRSFWYLATPYSAYSGGYDAASAEAAGWAGRCMNAGLNVFAPVIMGHQVSRSGLLNDDSWAAWMERCAPFMEAASGLLIARMPDWEKSRGIIQERAVFEAAGKPVVLIR